MEWLYDADVTIYTLLIYARVEVSTLTIDLKR